MTIDPTDTTTTEMTRPVGMVCSNFTDVVRRPLVIGRIDSMNLPFVVTMPQVGVGATVLLALLVSRPLWSLAVPDRAEFVVLVSVPVLIAHRVSRTQWEGRPVFLTGIGWCRLMARRRRTWSADRWRPTPTVAAVTISSRYTPHHTTAPFRVRSRRGRGRR